MSTTTAASSAARHSYDHFETPILDTESFRLLQNISEQGGYAYVSMASLAASGDFRAAEAARDMAWEQLHSGPWHSVLPVWRDAYSMACLHVAKFHYAKSEFKDALRALDMGLIMGGMLLRDDLSSAVEAVSEKARNATGSEEGTQVFELPLVSDEKLSEAEVFRVLPPNSLCGKIVGKKSDLSLDGFLRDHFLAGSPVIISDHMAHWPAMSKWNNIYYLRKVAGERTVPVKVGKNYMCPEGKQELITFSEFLQRIQACDNSSSVPAYLAQHPLFDQISELRKDICIPDYCLGSGGELKTLNAWAGPAGTVTPLHDDPHHNILAQVVGKKYVRLYSVSLSEELYPYAETLLNNSGQVYLDNIDESKFPKARDFDIMDCVLEEGEMLYIPPKWWHCGRSLTTSISISFRWGESENSNSL